jgi:hypothetical protein
MMPMVVMAGLTRILTAGLLRLALLQLRLEGSQLRRRVSGGLIAACGQLGLVGVRRIDTVDAHGLSSVRKGVPKARN